MKLSTNNFLTAIKSIVMGGGLNTVGEPFNDAGFLVDRPVPLSALDLSTNVALAADETNARVLHVTETNDSVFHLTIPVPRDYDEETDQFYVRVLASQLSVSTDDDVELDSETYIKTAGSALGSDVSPAAPGTVLSTTEQWIEFDLSGLDLVKGQVINFELITNGANDTTAEEVLIHAVEYGYRSTLVSYNENESDDLTGLR